MINVKLEKFSFVLGFLLGLFALGGLVAQTLGGSAGRFQMIRLSEMGAVGIIDTQTGIAKAFAVKEGTVINFQTPDKK